VFKQVLSIFITAAILKLGQGMPPSPPLSMFLFYTITKANGYMLFVLLPMSNLVACLIR